MLLFGCFPVVYLFICLFYLMRVLLLLLLLLLCVCVCMGGGGVGGGGGRLVECCFTSTETVGLLGTGAQNGHLDFHTVPEL